MSPEGSNPGYNIPIPGKRESEILRAAQLPFAIAAMAVVAIFIIYVLRLYFRVSVEIPPDASPVSVLLLVNSLYILLAFVAVVASIIGYRLVAASGATTSIVIPPHDYELLAPLVSEGKSDAIDQYVRLSSLAKFTGTFTQLGLTGLPLATIFLTLFFSLLTIFLPDSFLDLAKLTLGAFIGSFVQRQVERRQESIASGPRDALREISETTS